MSRAFHIKKNYTAGTSALSTLVTKQATFVCKYLLAFDHWQTKSNPRNNTESEIAKRELIRLNQTQDFDKLSADLASAGPNSNEEEKELRILMDKYKKDDEFYAHMNREVTSFILLGGMGEIKGRPTPEQMLLALLVSGRF